MFLQLTRLSNDGKEYPFTVNTENITCIFPNSPIETTIYFDADNYFFVLESLAFIDKMLSTHKPDQFSAALDRKKERL